MISVVSSPPRLLHCAGLSRGGVILLNTQSEVDPSSGRQPHFRLSVAVADRLLLAVQTVPQLGSFDIWGMCSGACTWQSALHFWLGLKCQKNLAHRRR
jgi:hypothetical protein